MDARSCSRQIRLVHPSKSNCECDRYVSSYNFYTAVGCGPRCAHFANIMVQDWVARSVLQLKYTVKSLPAIPLKRSEDSTTSSSWIKSSSKREDFQGRCEGAWIICWYPGKRAAGRFLVVALSGYHVYDKHVSGSWRLDHGVWIMAFGSWLRACRVASCGQHKFPAR